MSRYITRDYKTYNTIIKDCPIILRKTRILFDIETNFIILQIAIQNLSNKELKKITFSITTYDNENEIIDKEKIITIEEKIKGNIEYSINKPIILKNKKINYVNIYIKEVTYSDNLTWRNTKTKLEKEINNPKLIYTNTDLYKTLCFNNIEFHKKCYPEFNDNYWRCSCSNLNLYSNQNCNLCNASKEELKTFFETKKIENLILEYKQFCLEKREKEINKIKENTHQIFKKITLILILIPIIIFLFGLGYLCFNKIIYNKALKLYNEHKYKESIAILEKYNIESSKELLSDVYYSYGLSLLKDEYYAEAIKYLKKTTNKEKRLSIDEARYQQGLKFLNEKYYFSALDSFENISINYYKDTEEKIKEANYLIALSYFNDEDYRNAKHYFENVKNYKDANDYIERIDDLLIENKESNSTSFFNSHVIFITPNSSTKGTFSDSIKASGTKDEDKTYEGTVKIDSIND